MSATDVTIRSDVWLHALLHKLVCGERAGITTDDRVQHCLYCNWQHEDYFVTPRHEPTCPIVLGRAELKRTGAPA